MTKLLGLLCAPLLLALGTTSVDASCEKMDPESNVKLEVTACKVVDTSKIEEEYRSEYEGVLITGKDSKGRSSNAWLSSSSGLNCTTIKPTAVITATVSYACCDGDPNPPCYIDEQAKLSNVKIVKKPTAVPKPAPPTKPKKS